jgi:hypothetical protein
MLQTFVVLLLFVTFFFLMIAGIMSTDESYNMNDPNTVIVNRITLFLLGVSTIFVIYVDFFYPGTFVTNRAPVNDLMQERNDLLRRLTAINTRLSSRRRVRNIATRQ